MMKTIISIAEEAQLSTHCAVLRMNCRIAVTAASNLIP